MKIGFSTSVIQRGKTGVAQYVFALLRALLAHANRHEFNLFVLEEDLPLFDFAKDKMKLIPVAEKFRPAVKNVLWHQTELPKFAKNIDLDVLHVPSYRRMLWRASCPLVATIHDLAPFHIRGKYDWKRMIYGRVIVKQLARRQDKIIAVSENTARDLEHFFGLGRNRVNVVWNGIDHQRFQPGDVATAKALAAEKWKLDHPFFLFVSRLEHPGKNHVLLIEAFNQFKSTTKSDWLLALGGSDWHGAEAIHAAAAASPFAADIRFLGFVSDAALPGLYHATDVFIYPSLFEGFGFPPIEAMACGVPVISSTRGSLKEVVADAALTVEPENVADIVDALNKMSSSAAERQHWRTAGFTNAQRFDWNENAAQTLAIYERAIQRGKA
ncbi:MAG: glycosyltransferase family 1 protein [Verrucomicrobiota bacterium]